MSESIMDMANARIADLFAESEVLRAELAAAQARIAELEAAQGKRWQPVEKDVVECVRDAWVSVTFSNGVCSVMVTKDGHQQGATLPVGFAICRLVEAAPTDANAPG